MTADREVGMIGFFDSPDSPGERAKLWEMAICGAWDYSHWYTIRGENAMRLIIEARLEGYDIERTVVPIPLGRVNSHGFARSQSPRDPNRLSSLLR